jgi:hypothetical protein
MLVMQLLQLSGNIGEVGIEDRIAFRFPPEPVLHDGIQGDVFFPVAMRDAQDLVL